MLFLKQAISVFFVKLGRISHDWQQRKPAQHMWILSVPWKTPEQQLPRPEMNWVVMHWHGQKGISCVLGGLFKPVWLCSKLLRDYFCSTYCFLLSSRRRWLKLTYFYSWLKIYSQFCNAKSRELMAISSQQTFSWNTTEPSLTEGIKEKQSTCA